MPDISMCPGQGTNTQKMLSGQTPHTFICPIRDKCFRFTAKPNPSGQLYFMMPPMSGGKICEMFWDNAEKGK